MKFFTDCSCRQCAQLQEFHRRHCQSKSFFVVSWFTFGDHFAVASSIQRIERFSQRSQFRAFTSTTAATLLTDITPNVPSAATRSAFLAALNHTLREAIRSSHHLQLQLMPLASMTPGTWFFHAILTSLAVLLGHFCSPIFLSNKRVGWALPLGSLLINEFKLSLLQLQRFLRTNQFDRSCQFCSTVATLSSTLTSFDNSVSHFRSDQFNSADSVIVRWW